MNHTMLVFNAIYIALCLVGLVIFAVVFASTRKGKDKRLDIKAWKRRENTWLYIVILLLFVLILPVTLSQVPYLQFWNVNTAAASTDQQVYVNGQQFGFTTLTGPGGRPQIQPAGTPLFRVPAGREFAFVASSSDVNHAAGIYAPGGTFVAQIQMMPHYPATLKLTLDKPGIYTIRCFEYCGVGHHQMQATFEVTQ